jgi:hypothetical protein
MIWKGIKISLTNLIKKLYFIPLIIIGNEALRRANKVSYRKH